jgi:hypothetical protein
VNHRPCSCPAVKEFSKSSQSSIIAASLFRPKLHNSRADICHQHFHQFSIRYQGHTSDCQSSRIYFWQGNQEPHLVYRNPVIMGRRTSTAKETMPPGSKCSRFHAICPPKHATHLLNRRWKVFYYNCVHHSHL